MNNNNGGFLPAMKDLNELMSHFFNDTFFSFFGEPFQVDVYDMGSKIVVEAELPGFNKKQIKIETVNNGIKIIGEGNEELQTIDEINKYFKKEQKFHRVERFVSLPYEVSQNSKAYFKNGLLEIHIPKNGKGRQQFIKIE